MRMGVRLSRAAACVVIIVRVPLCRDNVFYNQLYVGQAVVPEAPAERLVRFRLGVREELSDHYLSDVSTLTFRAVPSGRQLSRRYFDSYARPVLSILLKLVLASSVSW